MFFLTKILESILPFLFSALKRSWDNLNENQQQALVNSGVIGQYIKNNLTALSGDLVTAISTSTGLPSDVIEPTLITIAGELGLKTTSVDDAVKHIQSLLTVAKGSTLWNGILQTALSVGATALSGGTLNWVHIGLGLGEYVYQTFIAPKELPAIAAIVTPIVNQITSSIDKAAPALQASNVPGGVLSQSANQYVAPMQDNAISVGDTTTITDTTPGS